MSTPKKEDIAGSPIYRLIARNSLKELHSNLMKSTYDFLKERPGKHTLVIAGQGPEVVPFSRNLDVVEEMIKDGNIAMFDYNPDIITGSKDALTKPRFDADENPQESKRKGIIERDYHFLDIPASQEINLRDIDNRAVIIRPGDLSNRFNFEDESVSVFDATLAIHHVTAYRQGLEHVISEAHRILEPGGLFHWGDGIVNMRYQEEKIHRVASMLQNFYQSDVALEDRRDPSTGKSNVVARAFYSKGLQYSQVPLVDQTTYESQVRNSKNAIGLELTKEGGISIHLGEEKKAEEFKEHLLDSGFKQVYITGKNQMLLPIIDQGMREDRDQFLESVGNYYRGIIRLNTEVFANKPDIAAKVFAVDNKEFGDASRGLFEYYTDPKIIMNMLQEKGFKNINYRPDSRNIWFNITAQKQ
jgi:SAM-dependent methyltransferase